ncbi:hypothetical protein [Klebsiella aerogenes]|uniref:hypothetical protein n=1 Tax=Klebsiella aerogenes TaxID=548 RepID=UPI001CC5285F|nr:hypothetical protein [Klebsiella aerogenes]UNX66900.1 hypothetical protein MQE04_18230 [Klebsiella aerogenes]
MPQSGSSNFKILQFLGFSGVASLVGLAIMIGRYQSSMDTALRQQVKIQEQVTELTKSVVNLTENDHMSQYRIAVVERRVDKMESKG